MSDLTAHEKVAAHYRKKARLRQGTVWAFWFDLWAAKAEAGHTNPLIRRVERMLNR